MNAFKCDRCKRFFLVTEEKIRYAALTTDDGRTIYRLNGEPARVYELCQSCHKDLLAWLEIKD